MDPTIFNKTFLTDFLMSINLQKTPTNKYMKTIAFDITMVKHIK